MDEALYQATFNDLDKKSDAILERVAEQKKLRDPDTYAIAKGILQLRAQRKEVVSRSLQEIVRLDDLADTARNQLVRLAALGNAGGTIATLSFIGTIVTKSKFGTFSSSIFWVLVIFIIGLICSWVAQIIVGAVIQARLNIEKFGNSEKNTESLRQNKNTLGWAIISCFVILAFGIGFGLYNLWDLTASVP